MAEVADYFTPDEPLGPENLEPNVTLIDELICRNNVPYKRLLSNPSIIVGRKGSGKSSMLRSAELDPRYSKGVIVNLPAEDAFNDLFKLIDNSTRQLVFVERVAFVWQFLLWVIIQAKTIEKFRDHDDTNLYVLSRFISGLNINHSHEPYRIMHSCISFLEKNRGDESIVDYMKFYEVDGISFQDSVSALQLFLDKIDKKAILLMDSLERFDLDTASLHPAIAGLLKSLATFRVPGSRCDIRCCIPAEIYFPLLDISSNPNKDFSNMEILHWTASELLELTAKRLAQYFFSHDRNTYIEYIRPLDLNTKNGVNQFWRLVLIPTLNNGVEIEETTLAYILRHTQLLPRHLIKYFNEIFRSKTPSELISEKATEIEIIRSIHQIEPHIAADIIRGYANHFQFDSSHVPMMSVKRVCEDVLKHLPFIFNYDDLNKINKYIIKGSIPWVDETSDILRVLIEIGAIGRYYSQSGKYYNSHFEYAVPHKLNIGLNDQMCMHPLFIGTFCPPMADPKFAVYPQGTTIEDDDYREWASEVS